MKKIDKYYTEIEARLEEKDTNLILKTLGEIRKTGHAHILPLLFNLANKTSNQTIRDEIFQLLGQLKEKECVYFVVEEIKSGNSAKNIARLITTCWQSGLNYSQHLETFTEQFVAGDYVTSIEAFTVIEEWIHDAESAMLIACRNHLTDNIKQIDEEKKALYLELVKLIESHI